MFQTKVVKKIKTHIFLFSNFFFPENLAGYEVMWKNMVERGRIHVTIWRMRIVCWIPQAINAHSEYVILFAFPLQQWLHERTSVLRHTYIASFVQFSFCSFRRMLNIKYVVAHLN